MNPQMMSLVPTSVVARRTMAKEDDLSESGKRLRKVKDQIKAATDAKKPKRRPNLRKKAQKFVFLAPDSKSSDPIRFGVPAPKPKPVNPLPPLAKETPKPANPHPPRPKEMPKPANPSSPLPKETRKPVNPSPPIAPPPGFSSKDQLFTKEAFLSKRVFHLHPFRNKGSNRYFGPFIAAGGVTVGDAVEYPVYLEAVAGFAGSSEKEKKQTIQDAITRVSKPKRVPWIRMWHEQVRVGDFIVLRHISDSKGCPHTPSRLFDDATGEYIGSVYVLGVVTALPSVDGECVQEIRESLLQNSFWRGWEDEGHIRSTFCPVKFLRMGFKASLKAETKERMMFCAMGELTSVCRKLDEESAQSILLDLWDNATIPFTSKDFEFGCRNIKAPELLSSIGLEYGGSLFRQQWK